MDYGFLLPETIDETFYNNFKNKYETILNRRITRWNVFRSSKQDYLKSHKLKRFIRKGIPSELREDVWMKCSGAEEEMLSHSGLYNDFLDRDIDPQILKAINADIVRTFSDNEKFINPNGDNPRVKSLGNILKAFALHNSSIGYCQGLNYIVAIFLLVIESEEKVFWLFNTLVTKILRPYYDPGMESLQVDCLVLEELIKKKMPKINQMLQELNTSCVILCTKWFICLYVDVLPVETTIRVLDCLMYEGDKILFRVALTIMKLNVKELTSAETFPQFVECFQNTLCNNHVIDCHKFIKSIFKKTNPLPYKMINKLRKICLSKLQSPILTN